MICTDIPTALAISTPEVHFHGTARFRETNLSVTELGFMVAAKEIDRHTQVAHDISTDTDTL